MKNLLLQSILLFLLLTSCSSVPSDVRIALEQAGINRQELEKVIEHYKTTGEIQKLKAGILPHSQYAREVCRVL